MEMVGILLLIWLIAAYLSGAALFWIISGEDIGTFKGFFKILFYPLTMWFTK